MTAKGIYINVSRRNEDIPEFIFNKNWEQDEYKALNEFCSNNNLSYEVLAVSYCTKQVAVKLIGI